MSMCRCMHWDDVSNGIYSCRWFIAYILLAGDCFVRPYDFIPERWYSQPELILDRGGFAPFSLGKPQQFP